MRLTVVVAALIVAVRPDAGVVNGELEGSGRFTPVVRLTVEDNAGVEQCTATLIGPKTNGS